MELQDKNQGAIMIHCAECNAELGWNSTRLYCNKFYCAKVMDRVSTSDEEADAEVASIYETKKVQLIKKSQHLQAEKEAIETRMRNALYKFDVALETMKAQLIMEYQHLQAEKQAFETPMKNALYKFHVALETKKAQLIKECQHLQAEKEAFKTRMKNGLYKLDVALQCIQYQLKMYDF